MTELADRLSRHADLHEHQPWADDEQMQFARDLREAVGLIAELARLRAQVPVGWIGPSGFTHNTATNRMWMRESPKLAAKLSPVYAAPPAQPADLIEMSPEFTDTARSALLWVLWHHQGGSSKIGQPIRFALGMGQHEHLSDYQIREAKRWDLLPQTVAAQPAEPTIDEQVASVNAVFDAWRNGEDATLTLGLAAQPAHPDEFACPLCFDDPANIKPAEPVQRLSDAGIEALAGKHVGNSKLTRVDVISARRLRAKGETFQSIADRFSVDIKTIMAAIKGKQWSHVIDPAAPKATK